jgi:hypothetical protein
LCKGAVELSTRIFSIFRVIRPRWFAMFHKPLQSIHPVFTAGHAGWVLKKAMERPISLSDLPKKPLNL